MREGEGRMLGRKWMEKKRKVKRKGVKKSMIWEKFILHHYNKHISITSICFSSHKIIKISENETKLNRCPRCD